MGNAISPDRVSIKSRIVRIDKESCLVLPSGHLEDPVMVKTDAVRWKGGELAVGDFVLLEATQEKQGIVEDSISLSELLPRKTALYRKIPDSVAGEQVIAANMDLVSLVHGLDQKINTARVERFLVLVAESGAEAQIILSKADLVSPDYIQECVEKLQELLPQKPILVTSIISGKNIKELSKLLLPDLTMVFLGTSGVGKSSLVNALVSKNLQKTAKVRKADAKGRHSTTVRSLIAIPKGGYIIDTPGLRSFGLGEIESGLDEAFLEIAEFAKKCKFRDCAHINEPDCFVKDAVQTGELKAARLERYLKLKAEADQLAQDKRESEQKRS